ncbi:MAG: hypothetical protein HP496_05210 [Nitrospira sp.]|nr:hypothetical protein [Nitrospira sp.]
MRKKPALDKDEEQLIAEYERGDFSPVKHQDRARDEAMKAAQRYTRKDARINIRFIDCRPGDAEASSCRGKPALSKPDRRHLAVIQ